MESHPDIEEPNEIDGYSGTFRWKKSKKLPNMPSKATMNNKKISLKSSWKQYLLSRGDSQFLQLVLADLCYIDCLSSVVTVSKLINNLNIENLHEIHLVIMGCSEKFEERILRETNIWEELLINHASSIDLIHLYIVGPEISQNQQFNRVNYGEKIMITHLFKGTAIQFFRSNTALLGGDNTICIGLNCGYGNFENKGSRQYDLLLSWLPDLYFLSATKIPLFFTTANDYADLVGEVTVMKYILQANFIMKPQENTFSFATTLIPPNSSNGSDYCRGNSFCYGVQSCKKGRMNINLLLSKNTKDVILRTLLPILYDKRNLIDTDNIEAVPPSFPTTNPTPQPSQSPEEIPLASVAEATLQQSDEARVVVTPVSETPDEASIRQYIENELLHVEIPIPADCPSVADIGLEVNHETGLTLMIKYTQDKVELVQLLQQITPKTMAAKYRKKANKLLVTAEIVK